MATRPIRQDDKHSHQARRHLLIGFLIFLQTARRIPQINVTNVMNFASPLISIIKIRCIYEGIR